MAKETQSVKTHITVVDDMEVEFTSVARYEDIGIGSYECHGYKGRDVNYQWVIDDIEYNDKIYTPEQLVIIEKYIDDNHEKIIDALYQALEQ